MLQRVRHLMFTRKVVSRLCRLVAILPLMAIALPIFHHEVVAQPQEPASPDLTKQPTLYVVGYAHLDTEWRWEYPQVINEYIRKTMEDNFKLFDKYPHYIFNFSGANRYRLMKEYFPADYEKQSRSPSTALVLALLLGGLDGHLFCLRQWGWGIA